VKSRSGRIRGVRRLLASAPGLCVLFGRTLAGVVQESGEVKKLGVLQILEGHHGGGSPLPERPFLRAARAMRVSMEDEGVLVDGVAVVGIADDECVDTVESGTRARGCRGVHRRRAVPAWERRGCCADGQTAGPSSRCAERMGRAMPDVLHCQRRVGAPSRRLSEDVEGDIGVECRVMAAGLGRAEDVAFDRRLPSVLAVYGGGAARERRERRDGLRDLWRCWSRPRG